MLPVRLTLNNRTYMILGKPDKVIDFAGMFFNPEIEIVEIDTSYVSLTDDIIADMSSANVQEVLDFTKQQGLKRFEVYETHEKVKISMSNEIIRSLSPQQKLLKELIHKLSSQPKVVNIKSGESGT